MVELKDMFLGYAGLFRLDYLLVILWENEVNF